MWQVVSRDVYFCDEMSGNTKNSIYHSLVKLGRLLARVALQGVDDVHDVYDVRLIAN